MANEINQLRVFLISFSYYLDGDKIGKQKMEFKTRLIRNIVINIFTYTPILNCIVCTAMVIDFAKKNFKKGNNTFKDPVERANFAQMIICAIGLGILLLPIHVIATVIRGVKNYNLSDSKKIIKYAPPE